MKSKIMSVDKLNLIKSAIVIGFVGFLVHSAHTQEKSERTVFVQGAEKYEVMVPLDQLGLLFTEKALKNKRNTEEFLKERGLKLLEAPSILPIVAILPAPTSRKELVKLTRELISSHEDLVKSAGFVIRDLQSKTFAVVTDQFIVQFGKHVSREQINQLHAQFDVKVLRNNPYETNQQLVRVKPESDLDALMLSNRYNENDLVKFAHPNFISRPDARLSSVVPNDQLFGMQWHLRNTGQSGGTIDADIDADRAWSIEMGNSNVLIAVLDGGFDMTHPDLLPNLWTNPAEMPNNNIDDDNNGYIDDVTGWDFWGCDINATSGCGDSDPSWPSGYSPIPWYTAHGTVDAGAAVARGNNNIGVSGSCPYCRFVPVRLGDDPWSHSLAIYYANLIGADIITNSWGCDDFLCVQAVEQAIDTVATTGRGGIGTIIFIAMPNEHINRCIPPEPADYSSRETVIAVSAVDNQDCILTGSGDIDDPAAGFGNCMDVLSPTWGKTLWTTTTDLQGSDGYNDADLLYLCGEAPDLDYTYCATGTSFATPVAAGVGGLILSVDPTLTRVQVQRLLQDTADKVQDSTGHYNQVNGFSSPPSGHSTHGYGRINAYEAVRTVAEAGSGGLGGVDVFIRDNRLDWGNGEKPSNTLFEKTRGFIPHWQSVDIKVDAFPFSSAPTTSDEFDAFSHENPLSNTRNKVYVRVRNRGPITAGKVTVKLHWAYAGTGLPALPNDFWSRFPSDSTDTSVWKPLGAKLIDDLKYSGASIAGSAIDEARIVSFGFNAPMFDPSLANPSHYCLFVVVDTPQDPVSAMSQAMFIPDHITPQDNNVTHRNVILQDSESDGWFRFKFFVRNPFKHPIQTALYPQNSPKSWDQAIKTEGFKFYKVFSMEPGTEQLLNIAIHVNSRRQKKRLSVNQVVIDTKNHTREILGGITIETPDKIQQ